MNDYIIIGAGISGLHTAHLLLKKYNNCKICLIEKENKIGGQIQTKFKNLDGKKIKYESGGAVVYNYQKNMVKLLKEFKIDLNELELKKKNKSYVINRFNKKDNYYNLKFLKLLKSVFKFMKLKKNNYCRNYTFEEICIECVGKKNTEFLESYYGYSSEFKICNSVVAKKNINNEIFNSNKIYFFKNGYSELIDKIFNKIKNFINLKLNEEMIDFISKENHIEVKLKNNNIIKGKKLIITIPKDELFKKKNSFNENELDLLDSVQSSSLTRIFLQYNIKSNNWINNLNHTTFINCIRQIIPLSKSIGFIQIYNDWNNADYFGNLTNDECYKIIKKLLSKILNKKLDNPLFLKKYYWKNAIHFWKPKINEKKIYSKILNIKKNVYICSESYSLNQGWAEGSVSMSIDLLKLL